MDTLAVVGDHRPPAGAAGDSGAARSWVRQLTSRVAASPYYPALSHPVLRRLLPGVALSALGDGMSMVAIGAAAVILGRARYISSPAGPGFRVSSA